MRALSITLLAGCFGLVATAAALDGPPPPVRWSGDHWTAWTPPPTPPPGAPNVHIVQRGDTLWDLAGHYLGNSYLWPQIWEKNTWILDAHWIYPGDPLDVGVNVQPLGPAETLTDGLDDEGTIEVGGGEPAEGALSSTGAPSDLIDIAPAALGPPQALGFESDLACSGFLAELDHEMPTVARIVSSEHDAYAPDLQGRAATSGPAAEWGRASMIKYGLDQGDIVYLDGGQAEGLSTGAIYAAVLPQELVRHPVSGREVGRFVQLLGTIRVLSVQATGAIGEIVQACDAIPVGSVLQAYEAEPVPLGRRTTMRPLNDPSPAETLSEAPVIVYAKDRVVSLGEDHVVFLDRGSEQDVTPGDVFTVYRMNREGLPPVPIGELAVLSVRSRSAVARIIQSRLPIYVGDRLERK